MTAKWGSCGKPVYCDVVTFAGDNSDSLERQRRSILQPKVGRRRRPLLKRPSEREPDPCACEKMSGPRERRAPARHSGPRSQVALGNAHGREVELRNCLRSQVQLGNEVCGRWRNFLEDYPYLEAEDIVACLEFAAAEADHPVLIAR